MYIMPYQMHLFDTKSVNDVVILEPIECQRCPDTNVSTMS